VAGKNRVQLYFVAMFVVFDVPFSSSETALLVILILSPQMRVAHSPNSTAKPVSQATCTWTWITYSRMEKLLPTGLKPHWNIK